MAHDAYLFYIFCSDYVVVCGDVFCVAGVVEDSVFLAFEC